MHDDPPPIVFEPRKRMRKTIASRDIPEEYARGKRYLYAKDAALNRHARIFDRIAKLAGVAGTEEEVENPPLSEHYRRL